MSKKSDPLLVAPQLRGREYVTAHSDTTDRWLQKVAAEAELSTEGIALAAIGGYARRELWPFSDVDIVLIHNNDADFAAAADALWYPVWDRGLKLGHSVININEVENLVMRELESATAFLDARHILGEKSLVEQLFATTHKVWKSQASGMLDKLRRAVESRHRAQADVAFHIEPNLKEGRGGLRDLQALAWAEYASPGFTSGSLDVLLQEAEVLVETRVELHRLSGRPGNVLGLSDQDEVAKALGDPNSNALMLRLAQAGRRIGWHSDEAWSRWQLQTVGPPRKQSRPAPTGLQIVGETIEVKESRLDDPLMILRLASFAAGTGLLMSRDTLALLQNHAPPIPEPWSEKARQLFAQIFMAGHYAVDVVEDLDQFDLMVHMIPEWENVRCHPQRNIMHTYTVDRHLCEAAANASLLMDRVSRPDLLVVGALLHDIGKGYPGDHTEVGIKIIGQIAERMGYSIEDATVLVELCRHHLLLPDVATRRDISDPGTISTVANAVGTVSFLRLLAALTEADSLATGPAVWSSWKAELLAKLVGRTEYVLQGGDADDVVPTVFPTEHILELMAAGEVAFSGKEQTFTAVAPLGKNLFGLVAGVLVVNGLLVREASSHSDESMETCQFTVQRPFSSEANWEKVAKDATAVLENRMVLNARVNRRARDAARYQKQQAAEAPKSLVLLDNDISELSSVIEIHASDSIGLLYRVVQALDELGINIQGAKVQTFGEQAVDSFYVTNSNGTKITDDSTLAEIRLALDEMNEGLL